MTQTGAPDFQDWLAELALAHPDEAWLQQEAADDFDPRDWHDLYFRAFDALRCDRYYGAMGGEGPIYYTALSRYARDMGIDGLDLWYFNIFMNAIDGEWLSIRAEEIEASKSKSQPTPKGA